MPRLATDVDVIALADLFCAGADAIGIVPEACTQENRPRLLNKLRQDCEQKLVWVLEHGGDLQGVLILSSNPEEIMYVVTSERWKRRGVGSSLIHHIQGTSIALRADAHNSKSEGLLKRCGFIDSGRKARPKHPPGAEYPIYEWRRS
jgi:hypothetical protein